MHRGVVADVDATARRNDGVFARTKIEPGVDASTAAPRRLRGTSLRRRRRRPVVGINPAGSPSRRSPTTRDAHRGQLLARAPRFARESRSILFVLSPLEDEDKGSAPPVEFVAPGGTPTPLRRLLFPTSRSARNRFPLLLPSGPIRPSLSPSLSFYISLSCTRTHARMHAFARSDDHSAAPLGGRSLSSSFSPAKHIHLYRGLFILFLSPPIAANVAQKSPMLITGLISGTHIHTTHTHTLYGARARVRARRRRPRRLLRNARRSLVLMPRYGGKRGVGGD